MAVQSSYEGFEPQGDYSAADNQDKIQALIDLIPDVDTLDSSGAGQGGMGFLDEMSPVAAVQLRVELLALQGEIEGGSGEAYATGDYEVTAGDATANEATVDTGIVTDAVFTTLVVSIERGGASVKADAVVTDNGDGTFTVSEDTTYAVTAGDTISWFAEV